MCSSSVVRDGGGPPRLTVTVTSPRCCWCVCTVSVLGCIPPLSLLDGLLISTAVVVAVLLTGGGGTVCAGSDTALVNLDRASASACAKTSNVLACNVLGTVDRRDGASVALGGLSTVRRPDSTKDPSSLTGLDGTDAELLDLTDLLRSLPEPVPPRASRSRSFALCTNDRLRGRHYCSLNIIYNHSYWAKPVRAMRRRPQGG